MTVVERDLYSKRERQRVGEALASQRLAGRAPAEGAQAVGGHDAGGRASARGGGGCGQPVEGLDAGEQVVAVEQEVGDVEGAGLGAVEQERTAAARSAPWTSVAMRGGIGSPRR